jgi:hypothetical protein
LCGVVTRTKFGLQEVSTQVQAAEGDLDMTRTPQWPTPLVLF